jgi:hypothetical protein
MPRFIIKNCLCPPCGGASHEWDYRSLLLSEMRVVTAKTGIKGNEAFGEAIESEDPEALTALIDILHRRAGVAVRWEEIDLDPEDFDVTLTDEERARLTPEQLKEFEAVERGEATAGKDAAEGPGPSPGSGDGNGAVLTPRWPTTPTDSGAITA